jgi:4-amino-4-deoxy-L-arabinose transferase-like glycosyltransferase
LASTQNNKPLAFAIVLAAAAALRLYLNDIVQYSPADESTYLDFAQTLFNGGIGQYPDLFRTFIHDRDMWLYPSPLRWSFIGATSLFCSLAGHCTFRDLATVSTLAGIVSVALTWWIGRELFDSPTALAAAALAATSPLQLALGRRALADEFFCMLVLASIATLLAYLRTSRNAWLVAWIVASTLTFGAKEQFLLVYPVILLFWWLRTRSLNLKTLLVWALPPLLYFLVACALAHDFTSFFTVAHLTTSTIDAEYPEQYQNGPPQRLIIDFISIAPIVTLAAIAAIGWLVTRAREATRNQRHLFAMLAGILVVHGMLSSKNLRYIVSADPLMRLLAATFVCTEVRDKRWVTVAIAINAIVELLLFRTVFLTGNVYDPITDDLLRALKMLPR